MINDENANQFHGNALEVLSLQQEATGIHELTPLEEKLFIQCEVRMKAALRGFLDMGSALQAIQKQRLYRAHYKSFDEYCRRRWQIGRFYAYRLIVAAELVQYLLTRVNTLPPDSEAQVRPLIGVDREFLPEIWERVVAEANGQPISVALVKRVKGQVIESQKTSKPKKRKARIAKIETLLHWIEKAKLLVERGYTTEALEALDVIKSYIEQLPAEMVKNTELPEPHEVYVSC